MQRLRLCESQNYQRQGGGKGVTRHRSAHHRPGSRGNAAVEDRGAAHRQRCGAPATAAHYRGRPEAVAAPEDGRRLSDAGDAGIVGQPQGIAKK